MNNKAVFFNQLHKELGRKFHIETRSVIYVRRLVLNHGYNCEELIFFVEGSIRRKIRALDTLNRDKLMRSVQLQADYENTLKNIRSLKKLVKFLRGCSTEEFEELTQVTEFDK